MFTTPFAFAVTSPVASTEAIAGLEEVQLVEGKSEGVSCVLEPLQILNVPEMVGSAKTVTCFVSLQPLLSVKVISTSPAVMPVTNPVVLTVAIRLSDEAQAFAAGVEELVNEVLSPAQTVKVPLITGSGLTVTVCGKEIHPFEFVNVIAVVPAEIPVTAPVLLTDATPGLEEDQVDPESDGVN